MSRSCCGPKTLRASSCLPPCQRDSNRTAATAPPRTCATPPCSSSNTAGAETYQRPHRPRACARSTSRPKAAATLPRTSCAASRSRRSTTLRVADSRRCCTTPPTRFNFSSRSVISGSSTTSAFCTRAARRGRATASAGSKARTSIARYCGITGRSSAARGRRRWWGEWKWPRRRGRVPTASPREGRSPRSPMGRRRSSKKWGACTTSASMD